jgi:diguanylate cyclase (GGDEF)-like protein
MNLPISHDEEVKIKAISPPLNNDHLTQISTRLLNEVSQDRRVEPVLRQLLEAAINAASEAEQRVIERETEIEHLRQLSVTDEATGLLNRRGFTDALHRALSRSERYGETGLLIVIDLDGFKAINDTHGHAAGDFVLKTVADILRKCVRQIDDIARIGGDEFAVLINQSDPKPAIERSQVISTVLNDSMAPWPKHDIQVRASIGAETYGPGACPAELFNRADSDMYAHKQRSRLRVLK